MSFHVLLTNKHHNYYSINFLRVFKLASSCNFNIISSELDQSGTIISSDIIEIVMKYFIQGRILSILNKNTTRVGNLNKHEL